MSMFSKLKQFKDLRDKGKELQDMLAQESVTVDTLGGQIVLTMDGNLQMVGLAIAPELLKPENKEKLEKSIKEAHKEAMQKIQKTIATKMQQTGGFDLSSLMGD